MISAQHKKITPNLKKKFFGLQYCLLILVRTLPLLYTAIVTFTYFEFQLIKSEEKFKSAGQFFICDPHSRTSPKKFGGNEVLPKFCDVCANHDFIVHFGYERKTNFVLKSW